MIIHKEIDLNKPLSDEQIKMLEALKTRPDQPDEDCPELTEEQMSKLVRVLEEPNKETKEAIEEVKRMKADPSLGKTYTDFDDMMRNLFKKADTCPLFSKVIK